MTKNFVSSRRLRQKTNKVWSFSIVVLCCCVAMVAGALLERHFGRQKVIKIQPLDDMLSLQQNKINKGLLDNGLTQLASQVAQLKLKIDALERLSSRLAAMPALNLDDQKGNVLPPLLEQNESNRPLEDFLGGDDIGDGEKIGRELDILRNKISLQEDRLGVMEELLHVTQVDLSRAPDYIPISMLVAHYSSPFGYRVHPISGVYKLHSNVDFAAQEGTPIYSASAGIVTQAGYDSGYGNMVEIDHGYGITTRYVHASQLLVKVGEIVNKKQMIARVASTGQSTGAHLHYEARVNNVPVDPIFFG